MTKKVLLLRYFNVIIFCLVLATTIVGCEDDDDKVVPAPETSSMTDIDGNIYRTVKIGNQWWMAENLKTKTFRNGSPISTTNSNAGWASAPSAWCDYANSTEAPGLLYNWSAVADPAGLAPEGWHVPTDEEWNNLEKHLGMLSDQAEKSGWRGNDEGEKLKMEGITGWQIYEGVWATNESGFSAEAGSCRMFDGTFGNPGLKANGFWWSATEYNQDEAWYRHLDYKERGVFRFHGLKQYGFSIRCVKNE